MPVEVKKQGRYELFRTDEDHRILVLDDEDYYAWVEGDEGEILVHSDSDHEKERTLQKGDFRFVDFHDDPNYKDMPHLFLEKNGSYQEIMLPNGFPTESNHQKKIVKTDNTLDKSDLDDYLKNPDEAGEGEDRQNASGYENDPDLPVENYNELTVDEAEDKLGDLSKKELQEVKSYERDHKDRKTMKEALREEIHAREND